MTTQQADIGLIGLAVMGENLVLNIESRGFTVAVQNRTYDKVVSFLEGRARGKKIIGTKTLQELVGSLKTPRRVMIMVKAGKPVDDLIDQLAPLLEKGDIIIDGGNSHFPDSIRRTKDLEAKGLLYVGTGVSGGEEGALKGPSIMPGGSPGRVAAREADLPGDRRQGRGRHALLRLGRQRRRRSLREDGAQRHRVRRHAAHLRGVPDHERAARHVGRRDARGLRRVEQGRPRQLPDRDHARHPGVQGRGRKADRRQDPRHRRAKGHRQVDQRDCAGSGHAADADQRGGLRALPVGDEGAAGRGVEAAERTQARRSPATARRSSTTCRARSTLRRWCRTRRATC